MFQYRTITLTYGDQAENHRGMQMIGEKAEKGFSIQDLDRCQNYFENMGCICERVHLNNLLENHDIGYNSEIEDADLLIIRNGVNTLLNDIGGTAEMLLQEQSQLDWDSKAFMYGRVVNKHARHNLCYGDFSQEPDYENGKGRVVHFDTIPLTKHIRDKLSECMEGASNLACEGNYYYDNRKTGISFHGDSERLKVVAVRVGDSLPIHHQWFLRGNPVGERGIYNLHHGDMYIMSEKTTGNDWKKKIIPTLRHAAGCSKYTTIK